MKAACQQEGLVKMQAVFLVLVLMIPREVQFSTLWKSVGARVAPHEDVHIHVFLLKRGRKARCALLEADVLWSLEGTSSGHMTCAY